MEYKCNDCNKTYSGYQSLWIHNKKFHKISVLNNSDSSKISSEIILKCSEKVLNNSNNVLKSSESIILENDNIKEYNCRNCNKLFYNVKTRWSHEKQCKEKTNVLTELQQVKEENNKVKQELALIKNNQILSPNNTNNSGLLNNQLINIIVDKTKTIEELQTKIDIKEENKLVEIKKEKSTLNFNDVVIVSRADDNYINATQLCQAGGKKFSHWYSLDTTKELINELTKNETAPDAGITASATHSLIEFNKGGNDKNNQITWIHPDLAIQLAQWISPKFALQVSKWIRTLFTTGTVSVDVKLLEDKEKEIKLKDQKIQLLEDTYNKKQKRKDYPNNIIYMLTTKENKKDRIYIIGKATILKDRLSGYNKTAEHEVIYYKQCKSYDSLLFIENLILKKLEKYKEKANRDRFILPVEKDINLFTDIIDNCVKFIDDN